MPTPPANVNYTFTSKQIEVLKAFGEVITHEEGEMLAQEGTTKMDFMVTISGETHIFVQTPDGPKRVGWMEPGQFAGDIAIITGAAALASTTMGKTGEVLHIPYNRLQELLVANSELSDIIVQTLTARRNFAHDADHGAVIVIGAPQDRLVFTARNLLSKFGVPHRWLSPEADPLAERLIAAKGIEPDQLPVVIRGGSQVMIRPSAKELSNAFGFDLLNDGASADVIVVGAGPAGLAASVYAASEGLSVIAIDSENPGGQAGTSSKIENYLGFPTGVSGQELTDRAVIQALKFGVSLTAPVKASTLERDGDGFKVSLTDGRAISSKAIVIATGAQYRRLPIDNIERYEGRGVYYGATPMEAQLCGGSEAVVVGAGNSAGQGAVFLSQSATKVHVMYRRADIRETMSEYLVKRLEETPNIILHPESEISALHGISGADELDDRLVSITHKNSRTGAEEKCDAPFVFLFVGAKPFTEWLPQNMSCDKTGFVRTGADLQNLDLVKAGWSLDRMPSEYETSWPRVYAVGDVRAGSVKRVASAVGQGSVVVSHIHRALAEMRELAEAS
ncbi:MAG: FAD-dependent oxidoreductase [Henriciella sp.]|nr:FAD-dependent oxidoreductase [Hyphomonadaceae bacterium]